MLKGNVLRFFLANYYNFIENFQFIIRSKLLMRKIILSAFLLFTGISIAQNENYSEKWKNIDSLEEQGFVESADSDALVIF